MSDNKIFCRPVSIQIDGYGGYMKHKECYVAALACSDRQNNNHCGGNHFLGDFFTKATRLVPGLYLRYEVASFTPPQTDQSIVYVPSKAFIFSISRSTSELFQVLLDIAESCARKGATSVILQMEERTNMFGSIGTLFTSGTTKQYEIGYWIDLFNNCHTSSALPAIPVLLVTHSVGESIAVKARNCDKVFEMTMTLSSGPASGNPIPIQPSLPCLSEIIEPFLNCDEFTAEVVSSIVELCDQEGKWTLNSFRLCYLLEEKSNMSTFPLMLMIALRLCPSDKKKDRHFNELILKLMRIIYEFSWSSESVLMACPHNALTQAVIPHFEQMLRSKTNPLDVQESLSVLIFLAEVTGERRDEKISAFFRNRDQIPRDQFQSFLRALQLTNARARERTGRSCFTVENLKEVLLYSAPLTSDLTELRDLLDFCNSEAPLSGIEVVITQQLTRLVAQCVSVEDLKKLLDICMWRFPDCVPTCLDCCSDHALAKMQPKDVRDWLHLLSTNDFPMVAPDLLIEYLRRSSVENLGVCLDIFRYAVDAMDDHERLTIPDKLEVVLRLHLSAFADTFVSLKHLLDSCRERFPHCIKICLDCCTDHALAKMQPKDVRDWLHLLSTNDFPMVAPDLLIEYLRKTPGQDLGVCLDIFRYAVDAMDGDARLTIPEKLEGVLRSYVGSCNSATDLKRLLEGCKARLPECILICLDCCSDHALAKMQPKDVRDWLHLLSTKDFPMVAPDLLIEYLRKTPGQDLGVCLDIFRYAVEEMDDHERLTIPDKLEGVLRAYVGSCNSAAALVHLLNTCRERFPDCVQTCLDSCSNHALANMRPKDVSDWLKFLGGNGFQMIAPDLLVEYLKVTPVKDLGVCLDIFRYAVDAMDGDARLTIPEKLEGVLRSYVGSCNSAADLKRLLEGCKARLPECILICLNCCTDHALAKMRPKDVRDWLHYLSTKDFPMVAPDLLIEYLRRSSVENLGVCLDIFRYAVDAMDGDARLAIPEKLEGVLRSYVCDGDVKWLDIFTFVNTPLLEEYSDTVLKVVRTIAFQPKHFQGMITKLQGIKISSVVNDIVKSFVVKVLGNVEMDDPTSELFTVSNSHLLDCEMFVRAQLATRCDRQMKLGVHFDSISSLTGHLQKCRFPSNLSQSLFFSWLNVGAVMKKRSNYSQAGKEEKEFVSEIFVPFCTRCKDVLFKELSVGNASFHDVNLLSTELQGFVSLLETEVCGYRGGGKWKRSLDEACQAWKMHLQYIKSQALLLNILPSFLPEVVVQIDEVMNFLSMNPTEQQQTSQFTIREYEVTLKNFVSGLDEKYRGFFEHFVVNAPGQLAAEKSVLFKELLAKERQDQNKEGQWKSVQAFSASLREVYRILERLLYICGPELTFGEMVQLGNILSAEGRSPDIELKVLAAYFTNGTVNSDISIVLELVGFAGPLKDLTIGTPSGPSSQPARGVLARYDFTCCRANPPDEIYSDLKRISSDICDEDIVSTWSVTKSKAVLAELTAILCPGIPDASHAMALKMLALFQNLGRAEKVWEFMHSHQEFVGADGYSAAFHDTVEDFLSQLGGEDYKILDNFKPVAEWVSILVGKQRASFEEIMTVLCSTHSILEQAKQPVEQKPFSQLRTAEENMDFVSNLFQKGLCALDAVLGQITCITTCCIYWFDLGQMQLRLTYVDDKKQYSVDWSESQVRDFEQRLGFVQYEEKLADLDVESYLVMLQHYRRLLVAMAELRTLGHQNWGSPLVAYITGSSTREWDCSTLNVLKSATAIKKSDLDSLNEELAVWKVTLQEAYSRNPLLRLFSTSVAQKMNEMIILRQEHALALIVCNLFSRSRDFFVKLTGITNDVLSRQDAGNDSMQWPERVAGVLEQILTLLSAEDYTPIFQDGKMAPQQQALCAPAKSQFGIPQRYSSPPSHAALMRLLTVIYTSRPPLAYEILWCQNTTTANELSAFLERAAHHSNGCFTLLQVDRLIPTLQQIVMKFFLERRDVATMQHQPCNLHCVESGPNVMQSVSWIPIISADELTADMSESSFVSTMQSWVYDSGCFDPSEVICFAGPTGSGKTYQLKKHMSYIKNCEFGIVSITEAFSVSDAISKMLSISAETLDNAAETKSVIAFQINLGKFKESEKAQFSFLLESISRFFVNLLVLRCVEDPASGNVFVVPPGCGLRIFIELPDRSGHFGGTASTATEQDMLFVEELPVVLSVAKVINAAQCPFDVGDEAKHVCKYLSAYEDGSIDDLYGAGGGGPKKIMFVLDNSSSMKTADRISVCKTHMTDIFGSKIGPTDSAGMIVFNREISIDIAPSLWTPSHRRYVATSLKSVRASRGTDMWPALERAIQHLNSGTTSVNKWLVALTDGETGGSWATVHSLLRSPSGASIRVLFIAVGLRSKYEDVIRNTCIRDTNCGDAIIHADSGSVSLANAWKEVGERLTVSQKIEKKGADLATVECERLLRKYMYLDASNQSWSRLKQTYWIKYLHRRCGILAASEKFNKNKDMPHFGSTTMQLMLGEVAHALADNFQVDWNTVNHEQLVYSRETVLLDGVPSDDYKWSILATNPGDVRDSEWGKRLQMLKSLRMHVPSLQDLARRDIRVLESYLALGIGVELHRPKQELSSTGEPFDFRIGSLPMIDENQFVLTLDFAMKMLSINERIECRVPCIMEGETGVSKTALTRMLFLLKNTHFKEPSHMLQAIQQGARDCGSKEQDARELGALRSLADLWRMSSLADDAAVWHSAPSLAQHLCAGNDAVVKTALLEDLKVDPGLDPLVDLSLEAVLEAGAALLSWFVRVQVSRMEQPPEQWSFHAVDVHAALTPDDIANSSVIGVRHVIARARRMQKLADGLDSQSHRKATICIFFDEVNTSSCMGVFKELLIDHSLEGDSLPDNIVIIAACNPARDKIEVGGERRQELGTEWAIGHYQVHPLPLSLQQMTWDYGSLSAEQEREFIAKKLEFIVRGGGYTGVNIALLSKLIETSQKMIRDFAKDHIKALVHSQPRGQNTISEAELEARSSSAVSLRDVLRVFKLFSFFAKCRGELENVFIGPYSTPEEKCHNALLLAVVVVYYLRLSADSRDMSKNFRQKFRTRLESICGQQEAPLEDIVRGCMSRLMEQTELEPGIAKTRGLQENIFMVVVCCLANVPLMIVGPPGSSKTLAVTIVSENARGEYSKSPFYKEAPALVPFRYQCSRSSTSHQIKAVFDRAIERQAKSNREGGKKQKFFVFMDEAGLPEEERESLKVLHYYLESHMHVDAEVGFVAITNHLLDAAKSNRCALLMRAKPDHQELMNIARGCLGTDEERRNMVSTVPSYRRGRKIVLKLDPSIADDAGQRGLMDVLCETFDSCMSEVPRVHALPDDMSPPSYFVDFWGNRDFMGFMKKLGSLAKADTAHSISTDKVIEALERNMNGSNGEQLKALVDYFELPFVDPEARAMMLSKPRVHRNPVDLIRQALKEHRESTVAAGRYLLVIDTTSDDSVLRSLRTMVRSADDEVMPLKLSHFSEDSAIRQIHIISQVKWAAEKGQVVLLSETEAINESFYDLFNQHFRKFEDRSKGGIEIAYHTNIAVGADSRRCKVSPGFHCIVHMNLTELATTPAPFLNRFEKYRLTQADLLESHIHNNSDMLSMLPALGALLRSTKLFEHIQTFVQQIHPRSFYGFADRQTVESAVLDILSSWTSVDIVATQIQTRMDEAEFRDSVAMELKAVEGGAQCALHLHGDPGRTASVLHSPRNTFETNVGEALLAQLLVRLLMEQLLRIVSAEQLFQYSECLPRGVLQEYLAQKEHFSLSALLQFVENSSVRKHTVIARTSPHVLALQSSASGSLIHGGDHCISSKTKLLFFAEFVSESQFTAELKSFVSSEDSNNTLLLLIDGAQTPVSQVNFTRHVIDELLMTDRSDQKSIVLMVHVPSSDLRVHHFCDTTYCAEWRTTFLNGIEAHDVMDWLELAIDDLDSQRRWDLPRVLNSWIPNTVACLARFLDIPQACVDQIVPTASGGMVERRIACLSRILHINLSSTRCVKDILIERYTSIWRDESGNYGLLQEHVREVIKGLASGELQGSLSYIWSSVQDMFTRFLSGMMVTLFSDYSASVLLCTDEPGVVDLFLASFNTIPIPHLAELAAPMALTKVPTTRGISKDTSVFPFFAKLSKCIETAATDVLDEFAESEEEDIWTIINSAVVEQVRAKAETDVFAEIAFSALLRTPMSEQMWQRYLMHFVSLLCPLPSSTEDVCLQHRVIASWLSAHEGVVDSEHRVAALHAVAQYNKPLLLSLAASVEPLAQLTVGEDAIESSLLAIMDGDEYVDTRLTAGLISAFYKLMVKFSQCQDSVSLIRDWTKAFAKAGLKDAIGNAKGVDKHRIDAMVIVATVVEFGDHTRENLSDIFGYIVSGISGLLEESGSLTIPGIWQRAFTSSDNPSFGEDAVTPLVVQKLVEYWNTSSLDESSMNYIFTVVMPTVSFTIFNRLPMLESLLIGGSWANSYEIVKRLSGDGGTLLSIFDVFGNGRKFDMVGILEDSLGATSRRLGAYLPGWMGHREDSPPAASAEDVFFLLMWKWFIYAHESDSLKQLASLLQNVLTSPNLAQLPKQRSVTVAVIQTRIIHLMAKRVAMCDEASSIFVDKDESDCVLSVLETMSSSSSKSLWAEELAFGVTVELQHRVEILIGHMTSVANALQEGDKIMSAWLQCAVDAVGDAPAHWFSLAKSSRPEYAAPLLTMLTADNHTVPFVRTLVQERAKLRALWALPDTIEFYNYITAELSCAPIQESSCKSLRIAKLLENLKLKEDGEYYRKLWVRVRVGVNRWHTLCGHEELAIDDSMSLWSVLTCSSEDPHLRPNVLMETVKSMVRVYSDFLVSSKVESKLPFGPDCLDDLAETNGKPLQDSVLVDDASLEEQAAALDAALELWHNGLDFAGRLATATARAAKWKAADGALFETTVLSVDLLELQKSLPMCPDIENIEKFCRFKDSVDPQLHESENSYHFQVYHSLDHESLCSLISALRPIQEHVEAVGSANTDDTVRVALRAMYPGEADEVYLTGGDYIALWDEEQRSALLATPVSELQELSEFLAGQLESRAYLFAHKGIELKQVWPEAIELELQQLSTTYECLADDARNLEAHLVKHELLIKPDESIHKSLAKAFQSKVAMFKQVPLLRKLKDISDSISTESSSPPFEFKGSHYVRLRQRLRLWYSVNTKKASTAKQWDWPYYHVNVSSVMRADTGSGFKARFTPWFLVDPPQWDAQNREAQEKADLESLQHNATVVIQRNLRLLAAMRRHRPKKSESLPPPLPAPLGGELQGKGRGGGRGRGRGGRGGRGSGRGRGSGSVGPSIGELLQADAHEIKTASDRLQTLLASIEIDANDGSQTIDLSASTINPKITEAFIDNLKKAISHVEKPELGDLCSEDVEVARRIISQMQQRWSEAKKSLQKAMCANPPSENDLRCAIQKACLANLPQDNPDMEAAARLRDQIANAKRLLEKVSRACYTPSLEMEKVVSSCDSVQIRLSEVQEAIDRMHLEESAFDSELRKRFGSVVADKIQVSCSNAYCNTAVGPALPANDDSLRVQIENALKQLISTTGGGSKDRQNVDSAVASMDKPHVKKSCPAVAVYLALANVCPSHIDLYRQDAIDFMEEYVDAVRNSDISVDLLLLLALSRILSEDSKAMAFRVSCLRRCNVPYVRELMTNEEIRLAETPQQEVVKVEEKRSPPPPDTPLSRWESLKAEPGASPSSAMDTLMHLVGLRAVKEKALEMYASVMAEKSLSASRRVPQSFNFALLGNPGTGKTTVGKLLGKMLHEIGVRRKATFEATTGEKLSRMGAADVGKLIDKATGGVLFIDEAYALDPVNNRTAAEVAMQLLDVAEERREDLTIILAGYKDDMETKLFDFNDGFNRRFNYVFNFEDYTQCELADILMQLCEHHGWPPSDPSVITVAAHRLSRGRGHKAFGNAGAVRVLFEKAYKSALTRDPNAKTITMIDIMGLPPTREHVPSLAKALDELDRMIGLESVKRQIHELVNLAKVNYDRELEGEIPYDISLNRVFLGNPGTGKTTVAKLFGSVLKGIGLLSDGQIELKQPSDLIGSHVGEAEKLTSALIKRCRGKVLIIDEAYALSNSSYGANALNELVGLVHGAPGEDIAVVLIGYEKEMIKMFRNQNAGLSRRFSLDQAFRFEDFDDAALGRVVMQLVKDSGLTASRFLRERMVKELAVQRSRPNFGNAGAAVALVARGRQCLVSRDPQAKELTLADFGFDKAPGDGRSALKGLCKIEHIIEQLDELKAVVEQSERDGHDKSQHLQSYVFVGNPGTGKTTIARLIADAFYDMGILSTNKLVKCSGLDMEGSFVGQTKDKVNELMADAQGGVLFIDEAYTLGQGHFSQQAVDQLVALMTEPEHHHKTVVILAGYQREMDSMLSGGNVGLRSRFTGRIEFPDWDAADCVRSVSAQSLKQGIMLHDDEKRILQSKLEDIRKRPGWANARDSDTMYRFLYEARAKRCSALAEVGEPRFTSEDIEAAASKLQKLRPSVPERQISVNVSGGANLPMMMMEPPSHGLAPREEFRLEDQEERVTEVQAEEEWEWEKIADPSDEEMYAHLRKACVDSGYDASHEKRQELIGILTVVQGGGDFPPDIIRPILDTSGCNVSIVMKILRPQVSGVLGGMRNAVQAEEERRQELLRLAEEARQEKEREHARVQERLKLSGKCPMGYSWHREGNGWRCAGGSHRVSDSQL